LFSNRFSGRVYWTIKEEMVREKLQLIMYNEAATCVERIENTESHFYGHLPL